MLTIEQLQVSCEDKLILQGIDLQVNAGEVHAIMGPNGSGKSTLANVLAGRDNFIIEQGWMTYLGEDLITLTPEQRAQKGFFMAFQYPVEIPGVPNINFLKAAFNAVRKAQDKPHMDAIDFLGLVREKLALVDLPEDFLYRSVNGGFSGGEKKRNEILQMALLEPRLAILDETDSGLDIDALKIIAHGVNSMRANDRSIILITHYQRLLEYIKPDFVHVLVQGKIVKTGQKELAAELDAQGYQWLEEA